MNDPGLDGPISNDANDVENRQRDERDETKDDEDAFLEPSRWWFASTAFPLVAEEHGIYIDDPKWLIGVNAAQLSIALISNLFLLLNMAERIRFSVAQPITIIGCLMVVTVYGAYKGHYSKEFKLTMSQRTLMLQTISFLVYLLAGAAVFAHVESWQYLDAVYWCDFTLLTVGIGDYAPMTHLGRSLLFPFAIGGIIILGLVIGSIRSLVLERGKVKLGARMVEKERRRILKKIQHKNPEVLNPIGVGKLSSDLNNTIVNNDGLTERERRREEFKLMRRIQEDAASKRRWTSLIISGITWLTLWFAGAAIFRVTEYTQNWSYFQSLYFSYTSLLTIGYGDFYPQSNSGKPFFVFWSLLAVPSLTILISNMGDTIAKGIRDLTLWIGNSTILPGEKGARHSLKERSNKMVFGKFFEVSELLPGAKEAAVSHEDKEDTGRGASRNDPEPAAQRVEGYHEDLENERVRKQGEEDDRLPEDQHQFHCILVKEIGKVIKHLNSSPPRKYTFDEWAWYLKLIGEDESEVKNHRKAIREPKKGEEGGLGGAKGGMRENRREKWSWVGNRSPLMGNKEESDPALRAWKCASKLENITYEGMAALASNSRKTRETSS
ncbi:hypothetical protein EYC84_009408 [Monilinia fructicola]|uniref:Potassium channel domain-containing protein n=1 Tax=Monilinia fructicola TaxID=38448 RepID=A0A5M9JCE1_MONFR|nr:hypothetical protein EYC84_009408 [Monilinia fructicola]